MDPVEARARRTALTFDGHQVTVAKRQLGNRTATSASVPVAQIVGSRWQEATATTRGFLRFLLPGGTGDDFQATFSRAEQHSFETLNAAVALAMNQYHGGSHCRPMTGSIADALTALATLLRREELTGEEYAAAKARLLT